MSELVAKNALASSSLSAYLSDCVNVLSRLCVYTTTQTTKFSESHLQVVGWYLNCSARFIPGEEKILFANLMSSALGKNNFTFEKSDIVELPLSPANAPKEKGRAKKTATQASSQVVTRSSSKSPVKPPTFPWNSSIAPSVAPSVAPSGTPPAFGPQSIATSSHNVTSVLSLPRKRKADLLDTNVTSSEVPNTLALIENMDMVQLMLDSKFTAGPLPAYTCIQEFITKVCMFLFVIF